jgi:hypothetical protein
MFLNNELRRNMDIQDKTKNKLRQETDPVVTHSLQEVNA